MLLPQSAALTAPSEKEPDIALSDRFIIALSVSLRSIALFLSLSVLRTALPVGEPRKKALASPFGRGGKSVGFFGEGYCSLSQQADSSLKEEA